MSYNQRARLLKRVSRIIEVQAFQKEKSMHIAQTLTVRMLSDVDMYQSEIVM